MLKLAGIEKDIIRVINLYINIMNYATGAAFNLKDLFLNFKTEKLKISCKECQMINGDMHKDALSRQIFKECYKTVLQDIINDNVTFELPVGAKKAYLHMRRVKGEDFKRARRFGKWKDVDFLSSFFSGYELALTMESKDRVPRSKTVYVDKNLKKQITDNTNKGKQYC